MFCALLLQAQKVYINELSIANISGQLDPDYDFRGWIELYNADSVDIELRDLYFSDEAENVLKYRLAVKRTLSAGGYALVWLNDEIKNDQGYSLDADADGGILSIADKNGNLLDVVEYPKQYSNVSFGRIADAALDFDYFVRATPAASNNEAPIAVDFVDKPVFSHAGGFYAEALNVSISCSTPSARIFYTTDGSEPGPDDMEYTGTPVYISESTPLRARAYAEQMPEGSIATATYMINERKPDLPVVFLTVDTAYLYNDTIGIYCVGTNGTKLTSNGEVANYNQDWTRPAFVEYLDEENILQIAQTAGIGIHGNDSRKYDLKAIEVKASKRFGASRFDYPLFDTKPGRRYKSFILRAGGQQDLPGFIFRDAYNQSLVDLIDLDYQAYSYAVLYVNAKYWGIRAIREKSSKDYIYSHYNYEKEEFDLIDRMTASHGNTVRVDSLQAFVQSHDFSDDSLYSVLAGRIDIDNFLSYLTAEVFVVNTDWPSNNNKLFSHNAEEAKFRWILQDLDKGLSFSSRNVLQYIKDAAIDRLQFSSINELLKNDAFKEDYITRMSVFAGSVYREDRMIERLDDIVDDIKAEYPFHVERWDTTWADYLDKGASNYRKNIPVFRKKAYEDLRINFGLGEALPLFISASEPGTSIHFNDYRIPLLPFDGKYFSAKTFSLEASAYANANAFAYWLVEEEGNRYILNDRKINFALNGPVKITAVYTTAPLVRRAGLYLNELSAANSIFTDGTFRYEDWIELYNASDSPIALEGYYLSDQTDNKTLFRFGPGSDTVPAFGYSIVWCSSAPQRGPMHTNFKLDKEGESIFLSREQEGKLVLVDSLAFVLHGDKSSFGRYPDGDELLVVFDRPSFYKANYQSRYNIPAYYQEAELVSLKNTPRQSATSFSLLVTDNKTSLLVDNPMEQTLILEIYTLTGQRLLNRKLSESRNLIWLGDLPAGMYLINCRNETESLSIKFFR
ncbi:MAG: CotH kinase family protein [Prolixibacteraceae bacterium]|nr:CotH kinase family protein [Prolixibacteraceae bacterium]